MTPDQRNLESQKSYGYLKAPLIIKDVMGTISKASDDFLSKN